MRYPTFLLSVLALVMAGGCSRGDDPEQLKKEIRALHESFIQAHLDKDAAFLAAPTADDYLSVYRALLAPGARVEIASTVGARVMILGGAPVDGERHIWWNFVSSDPARIERAKDDWRERRFLPVPGDDGYAPLPQA